MIFYLRILLFLVYFLILSGKSGANFPAESFQGIARPYWFNIALWEGKHILAEVWSTLRYSNESTTEEEDTFLVNRFEFLKEEIRRLEKVITRESGSIDIQAQKDLRAQLDSLKIEKQELQKRVKFILQYQISLVLDGERLTYELPFFRSFTILFPAVTYAPSTLPNLLIISPRERIEMMDSILLNPQMNLEGIEFLEREVERQGVSALVEKVGGIATYPSLLSDETELAALIEGIAHEWFHQYLFFYPLGRNYRGDYQMTIINETVADIAGKEIAQKVLEKHYPEKAQERRRQLLSRGQSGPGIDFNREMRRIRLMVDALLSQRKITEAEKFMEESRIELSRKGYFIRRLNQAYFAFHGSYGEAPASTSPIGPKLRLLRERSGSLGEFINIVSTISTPQQLEELAK